MKAIHNFADGILTVLGVVAYMQRYKIESNSQQQKTNNKTMRGCCLYAKIQNWKQFTTSGTSGRNGTRLMLICKDTKLKAIHNFVW